MEQPQESELAEALEPSASPSVRWRITRLIFPFLKLREDAGRRGCNFTPRLFERFLGALGIWLIAVFLFCYAILTMSAETFAVSQETHQMKRKQPACGQHMTYVLIAKRILEFCLLSHLCGPLMEKAPEDMDHYRLSEINLMRDSSGGLGVVSKTRSCVLGLFRRQYTVRWLSSFFPDYILLFLVVPCSIIFNIYLWKQKLDAHRNLEDGLIYIDLRDPRHGVYVCLDSFLYIYLVVLVTGFLYTTLELHVVPNSVHRSEFRAVLTLFIVLWSMNFFTAQDDRFLFAGAWGYSRMNPFLRATAALAQVFITHSTVMLGAILLGHSEHVRRTPDLPCMVFCCKLLPSLLFTILIIVLSTTFRQYHDHNADCTPFVARSIVAMWPWFEFLLPFLGGSFLLVSLCVERGSSDGEGEESDFDIEMDYDSTLMVATLSLAVFFNVNHIYEMEANRPGGDRLWMSFFIASLQLLGPIGLATFAFYSWKKPPLRVGSSRFRNKCGLWFAFVFAGAMFTTFQNIEDCETSSDLPMCCTYPSIDPKYNRHEGMQVTCDKDLRCMQQFVATKQTCALPRHLNASGAQKIVDQKEGITFDKEMCGDLSMLWGVYSKMTGGNSSAMEDAEHHEQQFSAAFRLFRTIGTAASVEMYFTIIGVLLKLIFLTQHENSAIILAKDSEHHGAHAHHAEEREDNRSIVRGHVEMEPPSPRPS